MTQTIINTAITFIVSGILGYCVSVIKNYKKKLQESKIKQQEKEDKILEQFKKLKENQLMDMRNDLSNKFFVYDAMDEVEDYLVISFREKCEKYFELDGNTWIHPMYDKSFKWKIKQTGYLK